MSSCDFEKRSINGIEGKVPNDFTVSSKDGEPFRINLEYYFNGWSLELKYDSFEEDMFCKFSARHEEIRGASSYRPSKEQIKEILPLCYDLCLYDKKNGKEAGIYSYGYIERERSVFLIESNFTDGRKHYYKDIDEIDVLFRSLLDLIAKQNQHVDELISSIENFDYDKDIEPIRKLEDKYPSFFEKGKLNETGYQVICTLIDTFAPELNDQNQDTEAKARTLLKNLTTINNSEKE